MDRLWAPWRLSYVTAAPTPASECVFCDAVSGRRDDLMLFRGRHCFVILNLYPYNNGHLMVVPNRHVSALEVLEPAEQVEMMSLARWYQDLSATQSIGFFQIGGGIAGDFPICVVPMLHQDLRRTKVPLWGYFCQISDSTTSYGSYSGAVPNEKITWGKLGVNTPKYIIESDATIVAPLIFAHVLGW